MDFEVSYEKSIGCGAYSFIAFFLLSFQTFKQAIDFQGINFAIHMPAYKCDIGDQNRSYLELNETHEISRDECFFRKRNNSDWTPCTKWVYERSEFESSLATELDLVCSKQYFVNLMYPMFFTGMLVGIPVTAMSDKIGRRFMMMSSIFISIPITVGQIFSHNIWVQLTLLFLSGCSKLMCNCMCTATLVELTIGRYREISVSNYWGFYTIGYIFTAIFGYFGRTWRMIYMLSLIPCIFYPLYICFIPESPRWLILKGRREQAHKVLSFMAKLNGRHLRGDEFNHCTFSKHETGNIRSIIKNRKMLARCFILGCIEWSFSFSYIGSSTNADFASNNIFITIIVMGIVELPTGMVAAIMAKYMGRRKGIITLNIVGIIPLLMMPFFEGDVKKSVWQHWIKVLLAMVAKLGFTTGWAIFDVYAQELIPTSNRNGSLTIVHIFAGVGNIVATNIHDAALHLHYVIPCLLYSGFLIFSISLIIIFLPETKGHALSQTLEQALSIGGNKGNVVKNELELSTSVNSR